MQADLSPSVVKKMLMMRRKMILSIVTLAAKGLDLLSTLVHVNYYHGQMLNQDVVPAGQLEVQCCPSQGFPILSWLYKRPMPIVT